MGVQNFSFAAKRKLCTPPLFTAEDAEKRREKKVILSCSLRFSAPSAVKFPRMDQLTYTPTATVQQAVQDSQRMLMYVVQSRLTLADDIVKTLTRAKNALHQNAWTPEEEVEFWKAFTRLNAAVKPVTIRSLKAVVPAPDSPPWLQFMTRARFFMYFYRVLTAVTLVVFVALQVYWLIGNDIVNQINALIKQREDISRVEKAVRETTAKLSNSPQGEATEVQQPVAANTAQLIRQLQASYISLLNWSLCWQKLVFEEKMFQGKNVVLDEQLTQERIARLQRQIETDKRLLTNIDATQKASIQARIEDNRREKLRLQRDLQQEKLRYEAVLTKLPSEFVLEVLQIYILPLICGFLGAALYVLRSLTEEIENVTYTIGSDIKYELRLALGALGGLGIGWFLTPEGLSGFQALSPLAISFLVGYNIELLFSVMDRFIEALSKQPAGTGQPPIPEA